MPSEAGSPRILYVKTAQTKFDPAISPQKRVVERPECRHMHVGGTLSHVGLRVAGSPEYAQNRHFQPQLPRRCRGRRAPWPADNGQLGTWQERPREGHLCQNGHCALPSRPFFQYIYVFERRRILLPILEGPKPRAAAYWHVRCAAKRDPNRNRLGTWPEHADFGGSQRDGKRCNAGRRPAKN